MTNPIADIAEAGCLMVIGSNTTEAHPIIGLEVKQAVRRGSKLVVVNPRQIELCQIADLWLRPRPGTDVALLGGMLRVILDEGLWDQTFVAERTEEFDALRESLARPEFALAEVERVTGVAAADIAQAARLYAAGNPSSIIYTMGITQHTHGVDNVTALANLAMITGNVGKPGSGVNPLRGQNNVQGACDMGGLPDVFTGYQKVADPAARAKFEAAWGADLNPNPGLTLGEILDAAHHGRVRAIYLVGENPLVSDPNVRHVEEALRNLHFLVVQDIFLTETAQLANVVLPAATFAEKDGTFTNTERRVQRVRQAIPLQGQARPDWWITGEIARRMGGKGFDWAGPAQIMEEIAGVTPSYGGITYARLENGGLHWPCPTTDHPGTPRLHVGRFTRGKGRFVPMQYRPSAEMPDAEYPLVLTTGRILYHYHTGVQTRRVLGLAHLRPEERVEINPADGAALGIADGDMVRVTSRRGAVEAHAKLTERSAPGTIFMTFHFAEATANQVTNTAVDPVAKEPELKVAAVRLEKVETKDGVAAG